MNAALRQTLSPKPPEDWTGPPPSVALSFAGPSAAPLRTIEANDLIGTLAAHGIAHEIVPGVTSASAAADHRPMPTSARHPTIDRTW